jgi:hypothetical protein
VHHGSASGQSVPSVSSDGSCTSTPPRSAEPSPLRPSNSLFLTLVGFRHLPAAASVRCPHHHRPRWSPPFPHPHQRFCTSAHHPRMAPTPVCCPASHRGLGQAPHACVGQPLFPLISFAQAPESHHPRCQSRRKPSAPLRSGTTTSFQTPRPRNVVASHAGMGGVSAVSRPAVVLLLWVESCTSLLSRLARSSPKSCLRRPLHFTSLLALAGGRGSGASCRTPSETLQPFRERCCSCSCRRPCYQPERACVGGARQFQCTAWIQFSISELHIQLPLSQIDCIRLFLTSPFHSSTSATGVTKQVSL